MFKLSETPNAELKEANKWELKRRLEALPAKIDVIRSMEVGINMVESARSFDLVLLSTFDSLDDLEAYRVHPDHQDLVEYIGQIREQAASVDYEY
jgi:hypothetical protein